MRKYEKITQRYLFLSLSHFLVLPSFFLSYIIRWVPLTFSPPRFLSNDSFVSLQDFVESICALVVYATVLGAFTEMSEVNHPSFPGCLVCLIFSNYCFVIRKNFYYLPITYYYLLCVFIIDTCFVPPVLCFSKWIIVMMSW